MKLSITIKSIIFICILIQELKILNRIISQDIYLEILNLSILNLINFNILIRLLGLKKDKIVIILSFFSNKFTLNYIFIKYNKILQKNLLMLYNDNEIHRDKNKLLICLEIVMIFRIVQERVLIYGQEIQG